MWHQWGLVDPSSSTSTMQKHKHNITQRQWTNQTNQPKTHFHVPDYIRLKSILLSKTCLLCDLYWRHCPQQNTWKVQLIPVVTWRQTQIKIKHKSKAPNSNSRHATISKITCNSTFSYKKISQGARFLHFFSQLFSATQVLKFTSCLGQSHFQCKLLWVSNWGTSTKELVVFLKWRCRRAMKFTSVPTTSQTISI